MLQRTPGTLYALTYSRGPAPLNPSLGHMWKGLWEFVLVPARAAGLALLFVCVILLYPIYVVLTLGGGWLFIYLGNEVEITDEGLVVSQRRKSAAVTKYRWGEIASM